MSHSCPHCHAQIPETASICLHCLQNQVTKTSITPPRRSILQCLLLLGALLVLAVVGIFLVRASIDSASYTGEPTPSPNVANSTPSPAPTQNTIPNHSSTDVQDATQPPAEEPAQDHQQPGFSDDVIELNYTAQYTRPDGSPSEGVTFTGVCATPLEKNVYRIVIQLEVDQIFEAVAFDLDSKTWIHILDPVMPDQKGIAIDLSLERLEELSSITVRLLNYTDEPRNTDRVNTSWLYLQKSELQRLIDFATDSMPSPSPEQKPLELAYTEDYINSDGTTCEGVQFTGLRVTRLLDGTIQFTVGLDLDRDFYVSIFEPPSGPWKWGIVHLQPGQTDVVFQISSEKLQELSSITVKAYTSDENRARLHIHENELSRIKEALLNIDNSENLHSTGQVSKVNYSLDMQNEDNTLCDAAHFTGLQATDAKYGNIRFTVSFELQQPMTITVSGDWGRVSDYLEANDTSYSFTLSPIELDVGGDLKIKLHCGHDGDLTIDDEIHATIVVQGETIEHLRG